MGTTRDKFKEKKPSAKLTKAAEEITDTGTPAATGEESSPGNENLELLVIQALDDLDMTREQAMSIVDSLFTDGQYRETIALKKGISVTFRTRTAEEEQRLRTALINAGDMSVYERSHLIQVHNLATSLVSVGEQEFTAGMTNEEFDVRKQFILTLPNFLVDMLARKLSDFDMKIALSCQDTILKGF